MIYKIIAIMLVGVVGVVSYALAKSAKNADERMKELMNAQKESAGGEKDVG